MAEHKPSKRSRFWSITDILKNAFFGFFSLIRGFFDKMSGKSAKTQAEAMREEVSEQEAALKDSSEMSGNTIRQAQRTMDQAKESLVPGNEAPQHQTAAGEAEHHSPPEAGRPLHNPEVENVLASDDNAPGAPVIGQSRGAETEREAMSEDPAVSEGNETGVDPDGDLVTSGESEELNPAGLYHLGSNGWGTVEYGNPFSLDYWAKHGGRARQHVEHTLQDRSFQANLKQAIEQIIDGSAPEGTRADLASVIYEMRIATLGPQLESMLLSDSKEQRAAAATVIKVVREGATQDMDTVLDNPEQLAAVDRSLLAGNTAPAWELTTKDMSLEGLHKIKLDDDGREQILSWQASRSALYDKALHNGTAFSQCLTFDEKGTSNPGVAPSSEPQDKGSVLELMNTPNELDSDAAPVMEIDSFEEGVIDYNGEPEPESEKMDRQPSNQNAPKEKQPETPVEQASEQQDKAQPQPSRDVIEETKSALDSPTAF